MQKRALDRLDHVVVVNASMLLLLMHLEVLFNLSFGLSLTHVNSTRTYDTRVSPD